MRTYLPLAHSLPHDSGFSGVSGALLGRTVALLNWGHVLEAWTLWSSTCFSPKRGFSFFFSLPCYENIDYFQ